MINLETIKKVSTNWFENKPFPRFVVDDFFEIDIAKDLESEFPSFDDKVWLRLLECLTGSNLQPNFRLLLRHTGADKAMLGPAFAMQRSVQPHPNQAF